MSSETEERRLHSGGPRAFRSLLWVLCALALLLPAMPAQAKVKKTYEEMKVKAKVTTFWQIKLSWPKKSNISRYVVYEVQKKDDGTETRKKIKTLSASKTSLTLSVKKGKWYYYRVEGEQKKKKNKQKIYYGYAEATTTLARAAMDKNQYFEGKTTPTSIKLSFGASGGLGLDGYEILRRPAKGGTLKKVKTITTTDKKKTWTDKSVKFGESYAYLVRTFKTIGGRRYVGITCTPVVMTAVNQKAKLTLKTKKLSAEEMTVTLKSDKGNGPLEVYASDLRDQTWVSGAGLLHQITAYSADGTNWIEFPDIQDNDMEEGAEPAPAETEEEAEISDADLAEADSSAETDPNVNETSDQPQITDAEAGAEEEEEGDSGDGSGMDDSAGAKHDGDMDGSDPDEDTVVYVNQIASAKSGKSASSKNGRAGTVKTGSGSASRAEGDNASLTIRPGDKLWLRVRKSAAPAGNDGMNELDGSYDPGISGWVFPASYHDMPHTYLVIDLDAKKAYSCFDKEAAE